MSEFWRGLQTDQVLNDQIIVTNSSKIVLKQQPYTVRRAMFILRNIADPTTESNKVITINIGSNSAVANSGIILKPGEQYFESTDSSYQCWQGDITAICAVASVSNDLSIVSRWE